MKTKLTFLLPLAVLLMMAACEDLGIMINKSSSSEQWELDTSNCRANNEEGSAAHCKWVRDIYTFGLSPLRVSPRGSSSSYTYKCSDHNGAIISKHRYTGFFIRTRGDFEHGPPKMLFSEATLKLIGFYNVLKVIADPNVLVGGHPLKEPWYPIGSVGLNAFMFFPKVPDMVRVIILELPYHDAGKKRAFSLIFKRI